MKKAKNLKSALRTCCAGRTRAMRLAACVHEVHTCTVFFMGLYVREDMEVQV